MTYTAYHAVFESIRQMLVQETAALVESGAAIVEFGESGADVRPASAGPCTFTVYVQSHVEVSFFPTAPGTSRTPTIDVFDKDATVLVDEVRRYVRAFLAGRVEFTLRTGSAVGRVRVWLEDGRTQTHLYNVLLGFMVGRGPLWDTFRPTPY